MYTMVVGLVGKIGSGKSHFVKYILDKYKNIDIKVFSCDDIAKELMDSGRTSYKGKNIKPEIFFTDQKLQEEVRNTLHPEVFRTIERLIDECKSEHNSNETLFIIESALPSELMYGLCDKVIYIKSSYDNSSYRLKESRGYIDEQIKLIFDSQRYYEKYYDMADYVIDNNSTLNDFNEKIDEVMNEICFICK